MVVPAYNEARSIGTCVRRLEAYFRRRRRPFEIIVVDDGSRDGTARAARKAAGSRRNVRVISYPDNRGKGYAVRRGVLASSGSRVLFLDADLSTKPEEWPKLERRMGPLTPVVIGSRKMVGARLVRRQPWWRERLGKIFTSLVRTLLVDVSDVTCGFKAFEGAVARQLFSAQRLEDWSFDAEVLFLAARRRLTITEVPVVWRDDPNTKVRVASAALRSLWGIARIRWNAAAGAYNSR